MLKAPLVLALMLIVLVSVTPTIADELPIINNPPAKQEAGKTTESKENSKAQKQNSIPPLAITNPTPSPPLQEIRANKGTQYSQKQKSSWWDFSLTDALLAIFTFALVVVGLFQFCILRGTLKETATAAKAAQDSAEALPKMERAYLFVEVILDPSDHDPGEVLREMPGVNKVKIVITNHGKTSAILKRLTIVNTTYFSEKVDLFFPFGTTLIESGKYTIYFTRFFIHDANEWEEVTRDESNLICQGIVQYSDVFDISHFEVGFSWQWYDLFERFNPYKQGNYRKQINQD